MAMPMVKIMSTELLRSGPRRDSAQGERADFDRDIFRKLLAQSPKRKNSAKPAEGAKSKAKKSNKDEKLPGRRAKEPAFPKTFPLSLQDIEKDLALAFKDVVSGIPWEKQDSVQGPESISRFLIDGRPAIETALNLVGKGGGIPSWEGMLASVAGRVIKGAVTKALASPEKDFSKALMPSPPAHEVPRNGQNAKKPLPEPFLLLANKETVLDGDFRKALLQQGKVALKADYFDERDQLLREFTNLAKGSGQFEPIDATVGTGGNPGVAFAPPSGEQVKAQSTGARTGLNKSGPNRKTIAGPNVIAAGGVDEGEKLTGGAVVKPIQTFSPATTEQRDYGAKQKGASFPLSNSKETGRESSSPAVSPVNEQGDRDGITFWEPLSPLQQASETAAKADGNSGPILPRPQELFEQIIAEARLFNLGQRGEMSIKLKPDYLGGLKMKVAVEDGQLKATFIVDNPLVKGVLETNMEALKSGLQKQGLNYQAVDVNVSDGGSSRSFNQSTPPGNFKGIGKEPVAEVIREGRQYITGQIDYRI